MTETTASSRPRALRTTLLVLGGVVLLAIIALVVVTGVNSASRTDASGEYTFDTVFSELDVATDVADVDVRFADVGSTTASYVDGEARRNVTFTAEASGSTLVVRVTDDGSSWWFLPSFSSAPVLRIVLPQSLAGLDVAVSSSVGNVTLDGTFGDLVASGAVGDVSVSGSAASSDVSADVGNVTAEEFAVRGAASFEADTGDIVIVLTEVPSALSVRTDVGDQTVVLPRGSYRVEASSTLGDVTVNVDSDASSSTVFRFVGSVGNVTVTH
ncbi:MAG TPA: DUF4097 family beta strand repeat-containing protein [Terrimesophilobacter sp.]|nr:DUF4097 family beta strand repeat-containing protein [Terrimesophilobacter sp.]